MISSKMQGVHEKNKMYEKLHEKNKMHKVRELKFMLVNATRDKRVFDNLSKCPFVDTSLVFLTFTVIFKG